MNFGMILYILQVKRNLAQFTIVIQYLCLKCTILAKKLYTGIKWNFYDFSYIIDFLHPCKFLNLIFFFTFLFLYRLVWCHLPLHQSESLLLVSFSFWHGVLLLYHFFFKTKRKGRNLLLDGESKFAQIDVLCYFY